MAVLNEVKKTLHLKFLYVGPHLSGKTASVQSLYRRFFTTYDSNHKVDWSKLSKNSYFDFFPISIGQIRGFETRTHIYTLPSHDWWPSVNYNLVMGVDGVVFVADSRVNKLEENLDCWKRLEGLFEAVQGSLVTTPVAFQFNRQDNYPVYSGANLSKLIQLHPKKSTWRESIATKDDGVFDCFQDLLHLSLDNFIKK